MDGGAWWAAVHGVAKCRTRLSDFTFTFHFHALEKEMATHSSVLAWRIPGTGACWAAVCGVAQSLTRLKRLSSSSSANKRTFPDNLPYSLTFVLHKCIYNAQYCIYTHVLLHTSLSYLSSSGTFVCKFSYLWELRLFYWNIWAESESEVVSNSLWPHGL